jgi:peptide-methionine (R)-S-oxide reductase
MLALALSAAAMTGFRVRPLQQTDILPVAQLLLRSFEPPGGYNPLQRALIVAEHAASLRERSSEPGSNLLLVGTADAVGSRDAVVAFVEAYLGGPGQATLPDRLQTQPNLGPHVASLAVDPDCRSRGFGEALMLECENRLAGRGTISLEVEEGNDPALRLYSRLGYKVVSRDAAGRKLEGDIFFGRSVQVTKLWLEKNQQEEAAAQQAVSTQATGQQPEDPEERSLTSQRRGLMACVGGLVAASAWWRPLAAVAETPSSPSKGRYLVEDADGVPWSEALSPGQYFILRQGGTEPPFSSPLLAEGRRGVYVCAGCTAPLFDSTQRFDSGTGWPSFAAPRRAQVELAGSLPFGLGGSDVRCGRCGGHLGHVFPDGSKFPGTRAAETGSRFCIDGAALVFVPTDEAGAPVSGDGLTGRARLLPQPSGRKG